MSEVLILGCGYLGRVLAAQWAAEDTTVWATTRSPQRAEEWRSHGWRPVLCDVLDPDSLRALPNVPVIVYCVGMDRSTGASQRQVYVEGLGHVVNELIRPERPKSPRFIYISSTSVYEQRDGSLINEYSLTEPADESGQMILTAERLLNRHFWEALVLRCAGLYGPGRLIGSARLRAGEALTSNPEGWLNLIHVADAATVVRAAAERGRPGRIYNVCDGEPVRRHEFYSFLAEAIGAPPPRFASSAEIIDGPDRRIANDRIREELHVFLQYPNYRDGILASL